jgi:hypothetical protein
VGTDVLREAGTGTDRTVHQLVPLPNIESIFGPPINLIAERISSLPTQLANMDVSRVIEDTAASVGDGAAAMATTSGKGAVRVLRYALRRPTATGVTVAIVVAAVLAVAIYRRRADAKSSS